jgi:hypothetical protein
MILCFICCTSVAFSISGRVNKSKTQYINVSGEVTKKFISNNHATKSFVIKDQNYSFLPIKSWEQLKVGDIVTKQTCNNIVTINSMDYQLK